MLLLAGTAGAVPPTSSQTFAFTRGAFLARSMAARPVGMGEAFTAVADDASAISWNPGGLGQLSRLSAVAMYDAAGNDVNVTYAAAALPIGEAVAGLSLTAISYGTYDLRDLNGIRTGAESAQDLAFSAGVAFPNPPGIGGWTGFVVERVGEAVGGGLFGGSAGGIIPITGVARFGWAVRHLGPAVDGYSLPAIAQGGVSWQAQPSLNVAVDGGYALTAKQPIVAAGAEFIPWPVLALRAGYKFAGGAQGLTGITGVTAGGGFRFGRLGLDYAYQPFGDLALSHRVALVYGLGPSARAEQEAAFENRDVGVSTLGARETQDAIPSAIALYRGKDYDGALARAQAAIAADPKSWQAWEVMGNSLYAKGDAAGAVSAWDHSLALHPDNPEIRKFMDEAKATASQQAAKAPPPAATADQEYQTGAALFAAGKTAEAWQHAAAALKLDPSHWQAWQLVGNCQYAQGDRPGALVSYRYALTLHPDNPDLKAWVDQLSR